MFNSKRLVNETMHNPSTGNRLISSANRSRDTQVLIIAYGYYNSLRDDDLAYLMAINTKDLHRICGKLREDRFLTVSVPLHTPINGEILR